MSRGESGSDITSGRSSLIAESAFKQDNEAAVSLPGGGEQLQAAVIE
jgi:hypothetical protein